MSLTKRIRMFVAFLAVTCCAYVLCSADSITGTASIDKDGDGSVHLTGPGLNVLGFPFGGGSFSPVSGVQGEPFLLNAWIPVTGFDWVVNGITYEVGHGDLYFSSVGLCTVPCPITWSATFSAGSWADPAQILFSLAGTGTGWISGQPIDPNLILFTDAGADLHGELVGEIVPEPGTLSMLTLSLGFLPGLRRRRKCAR